MKELLIDFAKDQVMSQLGSIIQEYIWIVVLVSLPVLVLAVAYCFFGIKIYRVLLVVNGVLGGGLAGAVIMGLMMQSGGAAIFGFLLFGALIGALSWFFYKVFLFIQTFFSGLFATTGIMFAITGNISGALIVGVIAAIALAILICIHMELFIMITTAYKGAGNIASILSLFFITSSAHGILNLALLVAFTAAGFYVQKRFFRGQYVETGSKERSGHLTGGTYKIVGIEGMYKGFEFDLEDSITFGRDVDNCNVVFPDTCAGVSRIQCQISYDKKSRTVTVVDKYSSYGTTLNGIKLEINREMHLKVGDVIMFGENNVFKLDNGAKG